MKDQKDHYKVEILHLGGLKFSSRITGNCPAVVVDKVNQRVKELNSGVNIPHVFLSGG